MTPKSPYPHSSMPLHVEPVTEGVRAYGEIWRQAGGLWAGRKVGEFRTVRFDFDSAAIARSWVRTNPRPTRVLDELLRAAS